MSTPITCLTDGCARARGLAPGRPCIGPCKAAPRGLDRLLASILPAPDSCDAPYVWALLTDDFELAEPSIVALSREAERAAFRVMLEQHADAMLAAFEATLMPEGPELEHPNHVAMTEAVRARDWATVDAMLAELAEDRSWRRSIWAVMRHGFECSLAMFDLDRAAVRARYEPVAQDLGGDA